MYARNRRRIYYALIKVALWLALLAIMAGLLLTLLPVNRSFAQASDGIQIFVTSNGLHTDIVVPVVTPYMDWRQKLPLHQFPMADSSFTYVSFGWGDRRFYLESKYWRDLTLKTVLRASFWPTPAAMHVTYITAPLAVTKQHRPVLLSPEQYQQLVIYLDNAFQHEKGAYRHIPGSGYTGQDTFYEAQGKFYLPHNCNNWVNRGLKAAGVKTACWAPVPFAVMRHLR